jgi:hypothetical protein
MKWNHPLIHEYLFALSFGVAIVEAVYRGDVLIAGMVLLAILLLLRR